MVMTSDDVFVGYNLKLTVGIRISLEESQNQNSKGYAMNYMQLEHVNVNVANANAMAAQLVAIFVWKIRWHGPSKKAGYTAHVGNDNCYLALKTYKLALLSSKYMLDDLIPASQQSY